MKNRRQKLAMLIAILLAALLVLPVVITALVSLLPQAKAITQKEIDAMKKSMSSITEEKKRIQNDIAALKNDMNDVLALIAAYDEQIELNNRAMDECAGLIQALDASIASQQLALDEAARNLRERQEAFERRLKAMDRMEEVSYIGVLLEAQSFSDLLTRWDDIREIVNCDQAILEDLAAACAEIDARRADLDAEKQELIRYREELKAAELDLADLRIEQRELYSSLHSTEEYLNILYSQQEQAEKEALDEIAVAVETLRKQEEEEKRKREYVGGKLLWPLPGYTRISSYFGSRPAPIKGGSTYHGGIDIPAPSGTPIVAANSGVIIIKKYGNGYGNYVAIDHGGNMVTLYGHMSKFANIEVGQTVKKGDTIGYVGTTGISTGNHLHFEVVEGGVRKDPIGYLQG